MDLLNKRPLASAILAMLCALYVYGYTSSIVAKVVMILASVLFCLFIFIFSKTKHKRITLHKIIAVTVLITLLYAFIRIDYSNPIKDHCDKEVVVLGEVIAKEEINDYTVALTVKTATINGTEKRAKLLTYTKRTNVSHIEAGSIIKYSCFIEDFSSDGNFDEKRYYISEGYDGKTSNEKEITLTGKNTRSIAIFLESIRNAVLNRISDCTDSDTGSLLSALLLGEKSILSSQLRLDFTRLGCSHILALSGMHLAILSAFIEWLLSLLRANKILRKALLIPFVIIYSLISGLPISVVRAGLMLIISCLLFIFAGSRDPITNLFISVGIICIIFPDAIFSTALLLSAFATLGIISLSILMKRLTHKRRFARAAIALSSIVLACIFAIGATMFIFATSFDGISVFSIIVSPVISFLCEIYLYIGGFLILFGNLLPLNLLLKPIFELISTTTAFFSDLNISYLSVEHLDVKVIMILTSIALFMFMIIRINKKRIAIFIIISLFISSYIASAVHYGISINKSTAIYHAYDESDVIVINEAGIVTVIDTSDYTEGSAYTVYDAVSSLGIMHIDNYVTTHYSSGITESVMKLTGIIDVDNVYIKEPKNDTEIYLSKQLCGTLSSVRAEFDFWDYSLAIKDVLIESLFEYDIETEKERIALSLTNGYFSLVYLSCGMLESDTIKEATEYTSGADALILGRFGAAYNSLCYYGSKYATHDNVYIESESVALSQNAYERYLRCGSGIFAHKNEYILYVK